MMTFMDQDNAVYTMEELIQLADCTICPHECNADRLSGKKGYCYTGAGFEVASVVIHRGEEPLVSGPDGICNIFFTGCNMGCIYCQNHEISQPSAMQIRKEMDFNDLLDAIEKIICEGKRALGFVSPSHVIPQVKAIIRGLNNRGLHPVTVYNSNGYDKHTVLRQLNGLIDVYLPDFKYITPQLAKEYSDVWDYPDVAARAIKEMYWQMGSGLITDEDEGIKKGLIIRHLVLPGYAEESKKVLQYIAREISVGVHISLMSQYHPVDGLKPCPPFNRTLYVEEYREVVDEMERLGFRNGWVQGMDSHSEYLPDFKNENPFDLNN